MIGNHYCKVSFSNGNSPRLFVLTDYKQAIGNSNSSNSLYV